VNNTRLLSTRCYLCGQTARKKIRWFSMNSKMHYCLAECKEHGYIKGRFRVREDDNGKYYASGEAGAEEVRQRQLEVRKRRRDKRQKKKS
jgi:DNA-binding PadR family transcriptional regulator